MAPIQKARGIVLQRRFFKESDGIARLLTEEGSTLDFRVYGIQRSRNRSLLLLEPGSLIEIDFYANKNGLPSLKEGHVQEAFSTLKGSYASILLLSYFFELSLFTSPYCDPSPKLFLLVKGSLQELVLAPQKKGILKLQLLLFFQVRVIKLLGLLGSQEQCSQCNNSLRDSAHWNLPDVHFFCENCASQSSLEERDMACLLAWASLRRFGDYKAELEKSKVEKDKVFFLTMWKNLNLCIESFAGQPFQSSKELGKQLEFYS